MSVIPFRFLDTLPELPQPSGGWHDNLWVSDEDTTAQTYRDFALAAGETGIWPVVIPDDFRFARPAEDWIVDRGRLPSAVEDVGAIRAVDALEAWWDPPPGYDRRFHPFGPDFPGLTRRSPKRTKPFEDAAWAGGVLAGVPGSRLGLVRAGRPADIPAVIGWAGMIAMTDRVAALSAVLRSWEDRFGAVLVELGFDSLAFSVAAPPTTRKRGLSVAAEHRAFSPACFGRYLEERTVEEYAEGIQGSHFWRFSWL
ncbi:DUF4253 domain-containing protein [Amycolatopsis sp. cg5]|uniref:DUF4253 domain-containing protein n=1 Tax=Amycolatopsis sp. cg5 TaxID=3238802 RepID=UPI003525AEA7